MKTLVIMIRLIVITSSPEKLRYQEMQKQFNHGVIDASSGRPGEGQKAFGINDKGDYYRYTGQNDNLHFSGIVAPKDKEIRKQLQQ